MKPTLLDESGNEVKGEGEGYLVFSQPWPGMMRTLFNNHPRYESTYFSKFNGFYCTGDGKIGMVPKGDLQVITNDLSRCST